MTLRKRVHNRAEPDRFPLKYLFDIFGIFSQIKSQLKNQSDIESHLKGVLFCGKG
jgi:hypothetical protein